MAALTFQLTGEEYEALIALARTGISDPGRLLQFEAFLQSIEKKNRITRSVLWVQWQNASSPLPPAARFPTSWPAELRGRIELLSREVSKADVDVLLAARASSPINVLVTRDPAGLVGWTQVEQFFT